MGRRAQVRGRVSGRVRPGSATPASFSTVVNGEAETGAEYCFAPRRPDTEPAFAPDPAYLQSALLSPGHRANCPDSRSIRAPAFLESRRNEDCSWLGSHGTGATGVASPRATSLLPTPAD